MDITSVIIIDLYYTKGQYILYAGSKQLFEHCPSNVCTIAAVGTKIFPYWMLRMSLAGELKSQRKVGVAGFVDSN